MSRLLQALKNLEARPDKPAAEKRFLNHLADAPRPPSPDPPATATAEHPAGRPSPIQPPPADHPLASLSSGLPTIDVRRPTALDLPPLPPAAIAPELAPSQTLDLVASTPPAINPPPLPGSEVGPADARLSTPASRLPSADFRPPPPDPRRSTSFRPPTAVGPPRIPTLLERAIGRTLAEPQSSEPFRQLAERIKTDLDEVAGRSILIAGIGPDSQSHDVILSTAAVLAEAGEPVLVIDGDGVRRLITKELQLAAGTGLAELAEGQEPESDPICVTTFDNLSVLPIGKIRLPDPESVGNRLASLVQSLEGAFRLVLIDGGRTSDRAAPGLARLCDATYFVVHMGQTEVPQAQSALRSFRAAGARLLGCIATT